ncbi:MAG: hypothetical protein H7A37_02905 [Chlamydiales bacterium]|nr:hypothetical protein [Chlamydiia bacterium]MCP5507235.1 hypothetical protein [Chlamydiales bacterium]
MGLGNLGGAGNRINITLEAMKEVAKDTRLELSAERETAKEAFMERLQELVNPFAKKAKSKRKDKAQQLQRIKQMLKSGDKAKRMETLKQITRRADDFQRRNPELKSKTLMLLREQIKPDDTKDEILEKLRRFYPDVTLSDEALEFLDETTEGELNMAVMEAKDELNEKFEREITAGRNISEQARQAEGIGTPTALRDMYRDITGNPREPQTLFAELSSRYAFKDLQKVVSFLLHSLGADMKSKGPSIPHGELHRLLTETRTLQAILGVYRFFKGRMILMNKLFNKEGLKMPQQLNFEIVAKQFMGLCSERYPSADKVLRLAGKLGIEKWIIAKIIVFSQMRDAVREVSLGKVYKSLQHRDELFMALIEALEELEDEWEDYQDEHESEGSEYEEEDDDDEEEE